MNNKYAGPKEDDEKFILAYKFEKPILLKGYMIKTANDCPGRDPKDWIINCLNIDGGEDVVAHTVENEDPRDRFTEKIYRCDNPVWS